MILEQRHDDIRSPLADRKQIEAHKPLDSVPVLLRHYSGLQRTWRVMADLMLRREKKVLPTTENRRRYQALRLGRSDGDTLLTELFPYPSPRTDDWLYGRFGRYADQPAYKAALLPRRLELLHGVLNAAPRELIVCYGKAHWSDYQKLFSDANWNDEDSYRVTEAGACRVLLTPHFTRPDLIRMKT